MAEKENKQKNPMQEIKIEKIVLSVGGTADYLEKGVKLLEMLTDKKPARMRSKKRIPTWSVRPGLEIGAVVTIRGKESEEVLKKMLITIDNVLKKKQVSENN